MTSIDHPTLDKFITKTLEKLAQDPSNDVIIRMNADSALEMLGPTWSYDRGVRLVQTNLAGEELASIGVVMSRTLIPNRGTVYFNRQHFISAASNYFSRTVRRPRTTSKAPSYQDVLVERARDPRTPLPSTGPLPKDKHRVELLMPKGRLVFTSNPGSNDSLKRAFEQLEAAALKVQRPITLTVPGEKLLFDPKRETLNLDVWVKAHDAHAFIFGPNWRIDAERGRLARYNERGILMEGLTIYNQTTPYKLPGRPTYPGPSDCVLLSKRHFLDMAHGRDPNGKGFVSRVTAILGFTHEEAIRRIELFATYSKALDGDLGSAFAPDFDKRIEALVLKKASSKIDTMLEKAWADFCAGRPSKLTLDEWVGKELDRLHGLAAVLDQPDPEALERIRKALESRDPNDPIPQIVKVEVGDEMTFESRLHRRIQKAEGSVQRLRNSTARVDADRRLTNLEAAMRHIYAKLFPEVGDVGFGTADKIVGGEAEIAKADAQGVAARPSGPIVIPMARSYPPENVQVRVFVDPWKDEEPILACYRLWRAPYATESKLALYDTYGAVVKVGMESR